MIHIAKLHAITHHQAARIRCFAAGDHFEQRGFTRAVGANHTHNTTRRQLEGKIVNQQPIAKTLGESLGNNDGISQPRRGRDGDFGRVRRLILAAAQQILIGRDTRLGFRLPRGG